MNIAFPENFYLEAVELFRPALWVGTSEWLATL